MTDIEIYLSQIISERFAKDVRQAIYDAIYQCYYDSKVGALDLVARQQIANLVSVNNPTEGNSELHDIRVAADGTAYESAGEAVRQQIAEVTDKIAAILADDTKDFATIEFDEEARMLHFYDESGADVYEPVFIAGGGGGGTGGGTVSTVVKLINENGSSTLAVAAGKAAEVKFTFTSTEDDVPTGNGSCQITVNGVVKATLDISQGLKSIDVSKFLSVGSNTVRVKCTDMYGNYRALVYTISVVDLYITSIFDSTVQYNNDITFKYTPYGAIEKTIHILIDGSEFKTSTISASGKQTTIIIPAMSHGVHKLELYATAKLDEVPMESEHLVYDIMCVEADDTTPMIASAYSGKPVTQGEQLSIPYIVYDPTKLSCDISLDIYTVDSGKEVVYSSQNLTVDRQQYNWNTRRYPVGTVYFRIKYGSITKVHTITVKESDIQIEAETNDLELYLTSNGRSNNEALPSNWAYKTVTTDFSNVNWASTGWVTDENGDTCLRLNGDAKAEIKFKPFSEDLRIHGKTLELEFAIRDVNNRDAVAISCVSGGIGFEVKPDTAYIKSEQSRVFCNYKEEEKVRLSFVIESRDESRLLSIYLNGILSDIVQYPDNDNFQQKSPINITIGSEYCGVDLYTIRSYTTALTAPSIVNNFMADMVDVAKKTVSYEGNDIYDEYGKISFTKAKEKNSVMVITGTLPGSKGDKKKVKVSYYDADNPGIDYVDNNVEIDVQGTSSQYYIRKNWKLKCSSDHYIDTTQLPASVFCIKVDYAEATGTHNTQNANLIQTFYEEPIPPQAVEPKTRTTIYGKPILLFHQATETSNPVFYGKANYNYDKGAGPVFGFTPDYDVECWEFKDNISDACNFLGPIPENWDNDFEARYPDKHKDISRFKAMHDWVVSTKDDLDKFKEEFKNYFDFHYSLIYYVYTFFALMVDQRAKNMFLTYWGSTGKWQPWFYDNDTCFGINNWGELVYDYYHEDTDQISGENVYTGQRSVLWTNFRLAFEEEIKETYQNLRNNGYITYDKMVDRFITKGSDKWSESIYNEDSEFKYISMLLSDNDATNLMRVRGSGEEHFKYFIRNRINYCDSKWYASDYANDYAALRISTPTEWAGVEPNSDITVTAYSDIYAGVRYSAGSSLLQERVAQGKSKTFEAPEGHEFSGTETAIYGASQLSSLGDLAPLYCGSIDVSKADKLTTLKVGDSAEGYSNTNLKELSVGTNKLLKYLDICNCPNLAISLDLSGCPNIEEVYASGTAITGIELADSGCLRKVSLPSTIANLTLKHQVYIEEIAFDGYDSLKTLWAENCPTFNTLAVLSNAANLDRARLTNVNWSYPDTSALFALIDRNIAGIDEHGANIDTIWVDGTCHIGTLTGNEMAQLNAAFPYLTITYDNLTAELIYMSWDGTTELHRETIVNGANGVEDPIADGTFDIPTRESTAQYDFEYGGWTKVIDGDVDDTALLNVEADRYVYAAFNKLLRSYTVKFYNGSTLLQTVTTKYGSTAVYTGTTPSKQVDNPEDFEFTGWKPSPVDIQGDTACYAQYYDTRVITDSWEKITEVCERACSPDTYGVGAYKSIEIIPEDGAVEKIEMQVVANHHDEIAGSGVGFEYVGPIGFDIGTNTICLAYEDKIYLIKSFFLYKLDEDGYYKKDSGIQFKGSVSSAVIYKDGLYYCTTSSTREVGLYKYDGVEHITIATWSNVDSYYLVDMVVYNDEIHITTGNHHYKWDGTSLVDLGEFPSYTIRRFIVYNNELFSIATPTIPKVYKWDGVTWTEDTTKYASRFSIGTASIFTYRNELYAIGNVFDSSTNMGLIKFNGDTWVKIYQSKNFRFYNNPLIVNNDEIHIFGGTYVKSGSDYSWHRNHYKLTVPTWKQYPMSANFKFQLGAAVVYNNELHTFGGYNNPTRHNKYDGAEWTEVSTLPYDGSGSMAVVYNDEVHLIGGNSDGTGHSVWNGSTWTQVSTLPAANAIPVVYKGELLIFKDKTRYKWDGSAWIGVETIPYSITGSTRESVVIYNDKVHFLGGWNSSVHYEWDGTTWNKLSDLPYASTRPKAAVYNGELHLIGGLNGADSNISFNHYKWDGENWTFVENMPCKITNTDHLCVFRGHMHIVTQFNGLLVRKNPTASLTFIGKALLKDPQKMNNGVKTDGTNTSMNCGGWAMSDLREWLNTKLYGMLTTDIRAVIKPVIKLSDGGHYDRNIVGTEDKLWIPSHEELGLPDNDNRLDGQGKAYPVFTDNASRQRLVPDDTDSQNYWTRSTNKIGSNYFWIIGGHGGAIQTEATNGRINVLFGFCI